MQTDNSIRRVGKRSVCAPVVLSVRIQKNQAQQAGRKITEDIEKRGQ